MPGNNVIPITIIPIHDKNNDINYNFKENTYTLTNKIKDDSYSFDRRGKYVVKSSSCMYDGDDDDNYSSYGPFVAFNNYNTKTKKTNENFFICDASGSPNRNKNKLPYPKYTQDPYAYAFSGPGPYQGGGSPRNTWSTNVNNINIKGEWIQIELPEISSIFLFKYSILVPNNWKESISFPKKFVVVGSTDGNNWEFLDQQTLTTEPESGSQKPVEFNLNSSKKYRYFRLIVTEIFEKHTGVFAIKQWGIYGMPTVTVNRDVLYNEETDEAFTNKNEYNRYEANSLLSNYSSYKLSTPLSLETVKQMTGQKKVVFDNTDIYMSASFMFLAIGIWIYSTIQK